MYVLAHPRRTLAKGAVVLSCLVFWSTACYVPIIHRTEIPPGASAVFPGDSPILRDAVMVIPQWEDEPGFSHQGRKKEPERPFLAAPVFLPPGQLESFATEIHRYASRGFLAGNGDFDGRVMDFQGIHVISASGDAAWVEPIYEGGQTSWGKLRTGKIGPVWTAELRKAASKSSLQMPIVGVEENVFWQRWGVEIGLKWSGRDRKRILAFMARIPPATAEADRWGSPVPD